MPHHSPSWFMLSSKVTSDIRYQALMPAVTFTALAVCTVALRWYSRFVSTTGSIATEDYFVTAAMVLSIGITAMVGREFSVDGGYTRDREVRLSTLSIMLKLLFAQSIFYHVAINLVKASFVLLYSRLFSVIRPVVYCCYILLVVIMGAATWGVFGVVFLCEPIQSYWNLSVRGTCMNAEYHFASTSIIGIILDWAIWVLPIPVVGGLKLPHRQKVSLLIVFGLGVFVCVVSVLRLVLTQHFAHEGNVTKSGTHALLWSSIEINVAIICASLLVMKPFIARFAPAIVSEQPVSAREDARLWRASTGLDLPDGAVEDEEKCMDGGRRDTAISLSRKAPAQTLPQRTLDFRRKARPWSW